MKNLLIVLTVLLLIGCGEQKVDSSSMEAYTKSIQAMKEDMSLKEKELFENYIKVIVLKGKNLKDILNVEAFKRQAMDKLSGLTVNEIKIRGKQITNRIRIQSEEDAKEKILEMCHSWSDKIIENKEVIKKQRRSNQANESTDIETFNIYKKIADDLQFRTEDIQKSYDKHCLKYEN